MSVLAQCRCMSLSKKLATKGPCRCAKPWQPEPPPPIQTGGPLYAFRKSKTVPHWTTTPPDAEHVGRLFFARNPMLPDESNRVMRWYQGRQDIRDEYAAEAAEGLNEWWSEPIQEPPE